MMVDLFPGLRRRLPGWDKWETPPDLFARLDAEFDFTLDAAASHENAKCADFFTPQDDALTIDWRGRVWCNPPYGRGVDAWVAKAEWEVHHMGGAECVVMLLPGSIDTGWWHAVVHRYASEVRLIRGRLGFGRSRRGRAPFPSVVVVFRRDHFGPAIYTTLDRDAGSAP